MKTSEIKEFTDKELLERIQLEKETLTRLNMNHAVSPLDNPMKIKQARRNIARLMTVKGQREMSQNQN
jgi:large subunit ribosomal protein L29